MAGNGYLASNGTGNHYQLRTTQEGINDAQAASNTFQSTTEFYDQLSGEWLN